MRGLIRMSHTPTDSPPSPTSFGAFVAVGIALALFLPLSAADLYLSADKSGTFPFNATVISFIGLSSVSGLILLAGLARDRGRGLCSMFLSMVPLLLVFALLTIVQLSGGFLPSADWSGGGRFIYLPLYSFVLLGFTLCIASSPVFRRHHRGIFVVCLLGAAGSIYIDAVYPQTFGKWATRPAGFEENAGHAAANAVFLAIAAVDWTRSRARDMLLWLIAGSAVFATLSRGPMIMLAVAFLCYMAVSTRWGPSRVLRNLSMLLVGILGVAAMYSVSDLGNTSYSSENNDRVQLLSDELSGSTASLLQDSRVTLIFIYIDQISQRPIVGHGTGYIESHAPGPHNMFLTLWVENGLPGLAAYIMVLIVCFWYFRKLADSRGQVFCVSVFVFSFFTHTMLTTRPMIITLGLLAALASFAGSSYSPAQRHRASCRARLCARRTEVGDRAALLAR